MRSEVETMPRGSQEPKGTKYAEPNGSLASQELETGISPYSRRKGRELWSYGENQNRSNNVPGNYQG
jgi:hypothetical protein